MSPDRQQEERIRGAFAALVDTTPHGLEFDELAITNLTRAESERPKAGLVFGSAFVLVLIVGLVGWMLVDQLGEAGTDLATDSIDPALVGVPVSDEEFADALGPEPGMVPGTARLIAEAQIPDIGVYKVFSLEVNYIDPEAPFDEPARCVLGPSGGLCPGEITDFGVSYGASCSPSPVMTVTVQGLLAPGMTATFHLTDGTSHVVEPMNGIAIWAWDAATGIDDITVTNATPAIAEELSRLDGGWFPELPYYYCTN